MLYQKYQRLSLIVQIMNNIFACYNMRCMTQVKYDKVDKVEKCMIPLNNGSRHGDNLKTSQHF